MPKRTLFIILLIIILTGGVAITAVYIEKELSQPQEEPLISLSTKPGEIAPETTPTEPSEIDTSKWKTYRNEEYGYEVKYPKNWQVNDSKLSSVYWIISEEIQLKSPYTIPLKIEVKERRRRTLEEWISRPEMPEYSYIREEYVVFEGIEGVIVYDPITMTVPSEIAFIPYNDKMYRIETPYGLKMLKQILSTFKFNQYSEM